MPTQQPDQERYRGWRRHVIGVLGAGLITLGTVLLTDVVQLDGSEGLASFALRVGLMLGALWLALPQLGAIFAKYPPWLIIAGLAAIAVAVVQPKMLIYLIPLMGVLLLLKIFGWFTRPPTDHRPSGAGPKQPITGQQDSQSTRGNNSGING